MDLKKYIREVPNHPKPGVNFYDITTLLENKGVLKYIIDKMCESCVDKKIDRIVAIDARGFLLAGAMAYKLGVGVSLVRKKGKLPYKTRKREYALEYGSDVIEIHEDAIKPDARILIVDDLIATGGTLKAACELVEELGGEIIGISCIIDLSFLGGSKKLQKYNLDYLVSYNSE